MDADTALPPDDVLAQVVDVHCHPTDSPTPGDQMDALKIKVCAMATQAHDQSKVRKLAETYPDKVIPCFGWHPWFSHFISLSDRPVSKEEHYRAVLLSDESSDAYTDAFNQVVKWLPEPTPLSSLLSELRTNLTAFPNSLLGEVGLDRSFRIPFQPYGTPPPRRLSPLTVPVEHQIALVEAQIDLAVGLGRSISFHSVKAQNITVDFLDRMKKKHGRDWLKVNIDLHSCGLSAETWTRVEKLHPNAYISLSQLINQRSPAHESLIRACSPTRILAESDYHDISSTTKYTWNIVATIASLRGWRVEERWDAIELEKPEAEWGVVRRLQQNWQAFVSGSAEIAPRETKAESHRSRRLNAAAYTADEDWDSEGSAEIVYPAATG